MRNSNYFQAKKSMGQHFLHRQDIAGAIVNEIDPELTEGRVLEIGPGLGILTEILLEKGFDLKCAELDRDMIAHIQSKFPSLAGKILEGDVLRLKLDTLFDGKQFSIIGNFPYNISSQIVFMAIHFREYIPAVVGMFQKEMAERIISPPGSRAYGVISVFTQAHFTGKRIIDVPPAAFNPPPRVQSLVIKLTRREDDPGIRDHKAFTRIVKQSFSMRRKMLRNNLKPLFTDHNLLVDKFFDLRPEQLSLHQYVELTELYLSQINHEK